MSTYDKSKQAMAQRVFNGLPPAYSGYTLDPIPVEQTQYSNLPGTLGSYELSVTTKGVPLFDMPESAPHLVLLPQTVLLFYSYVIDDFNSPGTARKNGGTSAEISGTTGETRGRAARTIGRLQDRRDDAGPATCIAEVRPT